MDSTEDQSLKDFLSRVGAYQTQFPLFEIISDIRSLAGAQEDHEPLPVGYESKTDFLLPHSGELIAMCSKLSEKYEFDLGDFASYFQLRVIKRKLSNRGFRLFRTLHGHGPPSRHYCQSAY